MIVDVLWWATHLWCTGPAAALDLSDWVPLCKAVT